MLSGERNKKVVPDLSSLAWHLYLMDLIEKKKKKDKSIGRMQETRTSIRNEWK